MAGPPPIPLTYFSCLRTPFDLRKKCTLAPFYNGLVENRKLDDLLFFQQSIIKPATQTFDNWKSPPVPSYMNMMIFTYTNPDGIVKGEKPIVKEMGPYSYRYASYIIGFTK